MHFELMEVIWIEELILEISCYILKPNTKYPLIIKYINWSKKSVKNVHTTGLHFKGLFEPLNGFLKNIYSMMGNLQYYIKQLHTAFHAFLLESAFLLKFAFLESDALKSFWHDRSLSSFSHQLESFLSLLWMKYCS